MGSVSLILATLLLGATSAQAQQAGGATTEQAFEQVPTPSLQTSTPTRAGQTTDSAVGQAGVRQTRSSVQAVNPMARVNNRIQNRVQSRLRNRIDRNYDPRANATSPFESAADRTERSGLPSPR